MGDHLDIRGGWELEDNLAAHRYHLDNSYWQRVLGE